MPSLLSIALVGFFVWSGTASAATQTPLSIATSTPPAPEKAITVKLTAYNAVPEQTDNDPMTTASGARSNPEVIAARSVDLADVLPFGTIIALEAPEGSSSCGYSSVERLIGYRVIADSTHPRKRHQIDILLDASDRVLIGGKSINPALVLGVCSVSLRVVGKVDVKNIPTTQEGLAELVHPVVAVK